MLLFFGLYGWRGEGGDGIPIMLAFLAGVGGYLTALWAAPREWWQRRWWLPLLFLADVGVITAGLFLTQGFESDLYLGYFLVIFMASVGQSIKNGLWIGGVAGLVYFMGTVGSLGGGVAASSVLLMRLPFFFVIALICSYFSSVVKEEREQLAVERIKIEMLEEARAELESRVRERTSELEQALEEATRTQAKLIQTERMAALGQFAGGIAHDFNNVLTVILGYSECALDDVEAIDGRRMALQEIRKAAERAGALTNQLLAFSRRQILQIRMIDLNVVVRETEGMLRRLLDEAIGLEVVVGDDPGFVNADPTQLQQILMNLVVNARDAMEAGGKITIMSQAISVEESLPGMPEDVPPGSYVRLSVMDTGTGISPEVLPKIFEPFFTTKAVGRGTGLGLATVNGIVHQSGGRILVESRVKQGTAFHVYFPRFEGTVVASLQPAAT